ncbi:hypothetical protein PAAG_02015 [Paracoccidioides lutzii Pb01]|uniref:Uncharacterized protein n=1 Tax=Paracoccidioides lutzii (strain ATCC MYA-826 / Pb01) TaxID=502779 RepID=C1GU20_PARBA|nr:hypothetical protein PAAG_02015 [Paracoccidioides lutzii Pb01]EEH39826.2 hypothetical protein PAAG_02015 [Paracoccidioides lutzii Pb01]
MSAEKGKSDGGPRLLLVVILVRSAPVAVGALVNVGLPSQKPWLTSAAASHSDRTSGKQRAFPARGALQLAATPRLAMCVRASKPRPDGEGCVAIELGVYFTSSDFQRAAIHWSSRDGGVQVRTRRISKWGNERYCERSRWQESPADGEEWNNSGTFKNLAQGCWELRCEVSSDAIIACLQDGSVIAIEPHEAENPKNLSTAKLKMTQNSYAVALVGGLTQAILKQLSQPEYSPVYPQIIQTRYLFSTSFSVLVKDRCSAHIYRDHHRYYSLAHPITPCQREFGSCEIILRPSTSCVAQNQWMGRSIGYFQLDNARNDQTDTSCLSTDGLTHLLAFTSIKPTAKLSKSKQCRGR